MHVYSLCVHVCLSVFCSHALSCQCQSSPVQYKTEWKTLNHAAPLRWPRLHHGPAWYVITGFVTAFQSLLSHYPITTQTVWWDDSEYYHECHLLLLHLKICNTLLFLIFSFLSSFGPHNSPLFLYPPTLPPTAPSSPPFLHIPLWVGGKFNGDVGSQKGSAWRLSFTSAQYVHKSGSTYQPVKSISSGGWLPDGVSWGGEKL